MNSTNVTDIGESQELSMYQCGAGLDNFHTVYVQIHGYASLLVCLFGSVANSLNIAVLTRREMNSPTNAILTGLAVADLLVMLEYIPYASHMYLLKRPRRDRFTYGWTLFVLFHSNFGQVCHTISIWLTVTLAIWRYIAIALPQMNRELCSIKRTIIAIAGAYVICPIICVPLYLTFSIQPRSELIDLDGQAFNVTLNNGTIPDGVTNTTLYFVNLSETAKVHPFLNDMNFLIYSVVIKIIPCVALTILSLQLILALVEAKKRRQKLTSASIVKTDEKSNDFTNNTDVKKFRKKPSRLLDKERQTDRTTRMLLAILLLFLLTEFPQGVLGLLSVTLGDGFFRTCYVKLGEVMDILALINSAINFILYCAMSRQFRMTFNQLFGRWKLFGRWMPIPQHGDNNGNTGTNHTVTQVTQV